MAENGENKVLSISEASEKLVLKDIKNTRKIYNDNIAKLSKEIDALNTKKHRKLWGLALAIEILVCGGAGTYVCGLICSIFKITSIPSMFLVLAATIITPVVLIEGVYNLLRYIFKTKKIKKQLAQKQPELASAKKLAHNLERIDLAITSLSNANYIDYADYTTNNMPLAIHNIIMLNNNLVELLTNTFGSKLDKETTEIFNQYLVFQNGSQEDVKAQLAMIPQLNTQYAKLKKQIQNDSEDLLQNHTTDLITKNILPFAQVLNKAYTKVEYNYNQAVEQERKEQEKKQKMENKKIINAIKERIKKEREETESFYSSFGIDIK